SQEEMGRLLRATAESLSSWRGLGPYDREALYLTAMSTGFRVSELGLLTPRNFLLDHEPPLCVLGADKTKNSRRANQPIPPELAELLRGYLKGKPADQPVWPGKWGDRAAQMLRIDLQAAGIPYRVEGPDGPLFADFHSLRNSYIVMLDETGASLREV